MTILRKWKARLSKFKLDPTIVMTLVKRILGEKILVPAWDEHYGRVDI